MAKLPTIKFPRITAGFYGITMDGEFVGYVMKDVDLDSKETNWYVFDDNVQGKDVAMLTPADAIDSPDALLREAKDSAKNYFLNRPVKVEAISPVSPLKESEWAEEETKDEDLEPSAENLLDEDLIEDDNLYVSDDGEFEAFEDELELDLDDEEVRLEELALV